MCFQEDVDVIGDDETALILRREHLSAANTMS